MTRRRRLPPAAELFAVLGLTAGPELTDDDVRSAWRRVAAATHPDRADGGDPARFAAAAAAFAALRTQSGRGEALADAAAGPAWAAGPARRSSVPLRFNWRLPRAGLRLVSRVRRGRPARLALRVAVTAAASGAALAVAGTRPAGPALVTGAVTWLILTARRDLAPPS
ncbi:MAG: J domain-containing protein [Actinomycetota bacterium]